MPKEIDIQRDVLDYLTRNRVLHWRVPLGPVLHGGIRKKNPMTGWPDILGVVPNSNGKLLAIEVKTPKGKVAPHQEEVMRSLRNSGCLVITARSVEDVRFYLKLHIENVD